MGIKVGSQLWGKKWLLVDFLIYLVQFHIIFKKKQYVRRNGTLILKLRTSRGLNSPIVTNLQS